MIYMSERIEVIMIRLKIDLEEKIILLIEKNDLDLLKFCKYIGVSIMDFFKICEGRYVPRLDTAFRIAKILNCAVDDIFVLEEEV